MKKHVKNYLKAHRLCEADEIFCEQCGALACDIHHIIFKSQGGSDNADNLIALCRKHHLEAHDRNSIERRTYLLSLINLGE